MGDKEFKNLKHTAKNYLIYKNGQELIKGYKPDVVLKNKNNFIIMESEVSTSRKGYIGGMIKAAKFLTGENSGILVYVIQVRKNTTPKQIATHLIDYFNWIKTLTRLEDIFVISDKDYYVEKMPLEIFSEEFIRIAEKV